MVCHMHLGCSFAIARKDATDQQLMVLLFQAVIEDHATHIRRKELAAMHKEVRKALKARWRLERH